MTTFLEALLDLPLDAYVTVTTKASRTFTGAVGERGDNEFVLMTRRRTNSYIHELDVVRIHLDAVSSFEEHRDAQGRPLGCFFDFTTTGANKVPTVAMTLQPAIPQ